MKTAFLTIIKKIVSHRKIFSVYRDVFSLKVKRIIIAATIMLLIIESLGPFVPSVFAQEPSGSVQPTNPLQSVINTLTISPEPDNDATPAGQIISQTDSIGTLSTSVNQSAVFLQPAVIKPFRKKTFQFKDKVGFDITNAPKGTFTIKVLNSKGEDTAVGVSQTVSEENAHIDLTPPQSFKPGKYTVEVVQQGKVVSTQDFSWGVLALNTDQSIYQPHSTATIAMTVLDRMGNLVCNAQVTLLVTDPTGKQTTLSTTDKSIQKNDVCDESIFTLTPDYQATYAIGESEGTYALNLSAETGNGTFSVSDSFVVTKTLPFTLIRTTATRLYPAYSYPVTLSGVAKEDFSGQVTEVVPANFTISRVSDNPTIQSYDSIAESTASLPVASIGAILAMPFSDSYQTLLGFGEPITDNTVQAWYAKNGLVANDGIDFSMPSGTPILAADSGAVVEATENGSYGTTIAVQHNWGRTYYGYLSAMRVAVGDSVAKGQEIGLSGATGQVSQPEFHFAVKPSSSDKRNGYFGKVDPAPLLGITNNTAVDATKGQSSSQVQIITWNIHVLKGQRFQIGYQFQAPNVSPEFYTIGPARFFDDSGNQIFTETRQWQLAVDSTSSYQMQTGYYIGNTNPVHVTGLGFKPQLVVIKSDANTAGAMFSTTLMPGPNTAFFIATADNAAGQVNLEPDGFTVSGTMSTANVRYTWIAFTGADCSSTGMFCIGSYTGTGSGNQAIASVGFQPDLVWVKQSTAVAGNWRSSSMATNDGQFFAATAEDTTGVLFTTLDSTGFTVGTTNNAAGNYYYVAFKSTAGSVKVGSYTGNGTSQSISSLGFSPDWVFAKNAPTAVSAAYNVRESYGDNSSLYTATANSTGVITSLDSDGFSVGTNSMANGSTNTIYYAAFGGEAAHSSGTGTFKMESGTYTGTGDNIRISSLGFSPDLIIVKGDTTQYGVFRTSMMGGDSTAYLGNAVANFAGGIIAINPGGFTVGTSATVNSAGVTYYWTAYGNAWDPTLNDGASDFYIGAYYGNGIDSRDIKRLPFQADMVTVKRSGATAGVFRTSAEAGDSSAFFAATADAANNVQSLSSDGFQIGTAANVNTAANVYFYFGFKNGSDFHVGTYSGTGSSQDITSAGFQPDNIWVKRSTAVQGVLRTDGGGTNSALPFINVANVSNAITAILSNGFTVLSATETNASGGTYWYVAWNDNYSPSSPSYQMQTGYYIGNTNPIQITGLGFRPQLVILKSDTNALAGMFSTTAMPGPNTSYFIGTADNATGWVNLEKDGFTVSGSQSTANIRVTWIAFAGVDCSASGQLCVGEYTGDGGATQAVSAVGFQPDLVWVKRSTGVTGTFRTSSMGTNVGQSFDATVQDTTGTLFTTLDSTGFTVGSTNNVSSGIYYYVAFKSTAGSVAVGSYTGNGTSQSISGIGMSPDFVFTKNANAAASVSASLNTRESYGDNSGLFTKTANATGAITSLDTTGFSVGSNSMSNGNTNTIYYAAFAGDSANVGSGTFTMAHGTYTGTGAYQRVSGVGFEPDLIIVKGDTAQAGVFRTSMMGGDSSAYLDSATANLAGAITAINPNGFTVGTAVQTNSAGVTYYWTAYGNAWNPATATGSADFTVGGYYGNGIDSRNITRLPFQPDLVTVKRSGATGGVWRTSSQAGDTSALFAATNDTANNIQAINSDGFQVGTTANVNTAANVYWYFAFKKGSNFTVGSYTGTGSSQSITSPGFSPTNLWIKRSAGSATRGVERTSDHSGDYALPFINVGSISSAVGSLHSNGFVVGTAAETNANAATYWYAAWTLRGSAGASSPTLDQLMRHGQWFNNGVVQPFAF